MPKVLVDESRDTALVILVHHISNDVAQGDHASP